MLMFLAGCLVTLVLGIAANLLTPGMKPLWETVVSWSRRGQESQTRQQLKVLQVNLDQLNRFESSERELYLYLFRWLLGIIALLVAALACALVTVVGTVTPADRVALAQLSLVFAIFALVSCVVLLWACSDFTVAGIQKRKTKLASAIAKLTATLPEARAK
jgi:hypothetical protein